MVAATRPDRQAAVERHRVLAPRTVFLSDDYYGYILPVPPTYDLDLRATEDARFDTLATIGITREHGATPLQAWRNAVADINALDRAVLVRNLDLNFAPTYVRKFVFYLA